MTAQKGLSLITNARIVQPDRIRDSGSVLIEAGRIARLSDEASPNVAGAVVHNLNGATLYPGFIDVHIHGSSGIDTMEASADELRLVSRFLATRGVTGWLPTLVPAAEEEYANAVQAIEGSIGHHEEGNSEIGARVLGVHYEGPFVSDLQCGALHTNFFRTYSSPADVTALPVPAVAGAVKMMTVAPEIEGGLELISELASQGWIISLGHTRATPAVLDSAWAAGARHMTHFMNAMPPLHHRNPGPVGWGLARDEVTCDIIADGIHLDPSMLKLLLKLKSSERLTLISDAIAAAGMGDGKYQIWGETISVSEGRTSNLHGSIAGSVITMLDAVRMMRSLGVSEMEVARMAATNPARLLRVDHECGSIALGKRADLVALEANAEVRFVIVGGEW